MNIPQQTSSSTNPLSTDPSELYVGQLMIAKFEYKALGKQTSTGDVDISFKKFDRMKIVSFLPNNEHWVKVELSQPSPAKPIIGVAPRNYLAVPEYVEAMWDYKPSGFKMSTGDSDIGLNRKDVAVLVENCPNDWIKVEFKGKVGVVPKGYVKKVPPPPPPANAKTMIIKSKSKENVDNLEPRQTLKKTTSKQKMMKVLGVSGDVFEVIYHAPGSRKSKVGGPSLEDSEETSPSTDSPKFSKKINWPKSYKFSVEDSEENILFEQNKEGKLIVRAGSVVKLIERLTSPDYSDASYIFELLLTYRSFTTPKELLELLIERYNVPVPEDIAKDTSEIELFNKTVVKPVRLRVLNVLRKWVDQHWHDFEEDPILLDHLKKFTAETTTQPGLELVGGNIHKQVLKQIEGHSKQATIVFSKNPPEPYQVEEKLLATYDSRMTFMAFHPEEIARQLTLIEHDLFRAIKPSECLGQCWTKKEKQHKSPNILEMIQRFNKVSNWVASTIVQLDNVKTRADALSRFIEIAEYLNKLNNFNGLMEILAGLRSAAVHRLKKTWNAISGSKRKSFEELLELMSPDSNYTKFRTHLHKNIEPPCVPYLGVYLTDLTFLEDGNPDTVSNGLINFDKRRRIGAVINDICQYQQSRYCLKVVSIIRGFLLAGGEYVDPNNCYKLSLEIEPKDGKSKIKSDGKSWRTSSISKKKEQVNQRSTVNLYKFDNQRRPSGSGDQLPAPTEAHSPSSSSPLKKKPETSEISLDDLVDSVLEGNSEAVEQYLDNLNKPEEEKNKIREELIRRFEEEMVHRGATKVNEAEEEEEAIPFDKLIGYLFNGNTTALERYLEDVGDIYEAERIRAQVYKMFEENLQKKLE